MIGIPNTARDKKLVYGLDDWRNQLAHLRGHLGVSRLSVLIKAQLSRRLRQPITLMIDIGFCEEITEAMVDLDYEVLL